MLGLDLTNNSDCCETLEDQIIDLDDRVLTLEENAPITARAVLSNAFLRTTGYIKMINAPGPGKYIDCGEMRGKYVYGGNTTSTNNSTIFVTFGVSGEVVSSIGLLGSGATENAYRTQNSANTFTESGGVNKEVGVSNNVIMTGNATNDNYIIIEIDYVVRESNFI